MGIHSCLEPREVGRRNMEKLELLAAHSAQSPL